MKDKDETDVAVTPKAGSDDGSQDAAPTKLKVLREAGYTKGDAFVGGASQELYEPIPEYEGRHRYDPSAEWTEKEEKTLVRKVSLHSFCYLCNLATRADRA